MKLKSFSDIQEQSAVLAATTNRNFQHLLEEPVTISYQDNVIYVDVKKKLRKDFRTSYVKSMEIFNHTLRVVTRNSVYVFALKDKGYWDNSEVVEDRQELEAKIRQFEDCLVLPGLHTTANNIPYHIPTEPTGA